MKQLHPTLWRTCRVLAGAIRIQLLRHLHDVPGQSVSELAEAVGRGISDASQELRRLQSRGLLAASRQGARLIYRLEADPQVPSAGPLLEALNRAFAAHPAAQDAQMIPIAKGLAHARRIAILQHLSRTEQSPLELRAATRIPVSPLSGHLKTLKAAGWVRGNRRRVRFTPPAHPLARALVRLLPGE